MPVSPDVSGDSYDGRPPTLRLRVAAWDLICTIVLTGAAPLPGHGHSVADQALRVPQGRVRGGKLWTGAIRGRYVHLPRGLGGIGAALAAAGIGPFVSLLKGWYMSFWPVLSLAILMFSSVAGGILTTFSARYWL